MSARDERGHLEELYGLEVSPDLISRVTDAVLDEAKEWRSWALDAVYPVVIFDAPRVKIRDKDSRIVKNKAVYLALGNYMFEKEGRWAAFTRFLDDGRICLTNNAAERSLRGAALGRKSWLFAGSERGGDRAAFMYSLIVTAKLNDIDPRAWLADVLARMPNMPVSRLPDLLPWNWDPGPTARREAA